MDYRTIFRMAAVTVGLALAGGVAGEAAATTVSGTFSGFTLPDDDSGLEPDVTVTFQFDSACDGDVSTCDLTITLTYNALRDPGAGNVDTASGSFAQILAGVIFEPVGTGFSVDTANSSVAAETLAGGGMDNGAGFPTTGTTDISGHYSFRDDVAIAGLGSHILSSVGDLTFAGVTHLGVVGNSDLLPGTLYAGVETSPPDGDPFATLNDATDLNLDAPYSNNSDGVWNQNQLTAILRYAGTLTDISEFSPLFGTNGVVAPEPATSLLLLLGLAGFGVAGRLRIL